MHFILRQVSDNFDCNVYQTLIKNYSTLFSHDDSHKDITITFTNSDKKLKAHKCILKAASPILAAKLSKDTKILQISDVKADIFEIMLSGIYLNHITSKGIDIFQAYDLYEASVRYQIDDISAVASDIMKRRSVALNCQFLMQAAIKYKIRDLEETVKETFASAAYMALSFYVSYKVDDEAFHRLFALDELKIQSEFELYLAVETMYDIRDERIYPKCLSQIRFLSMDIADLMNCDLLSSEEKLAIAENADAIRNKRSTKIQMPKRLSAEPKPRNFLVVDQKERKIFWTAIMLKCRNHKKYLEMFYKNMEIPEKEREATEKLIISGRTPKFANKERIEEIAKNIFKF
ncbi:uncharacterized protein LOC134830566 [Culicoides brevitarsis]|uniref:uncharacterized protein LOC134830566 n=1 Tax=Culicoides brevitarsis TaxID=469753 RepID=UPI00307C6584